MVKNDLQALLDSLALAGFHGVAPVVQQPKTDMAYWQIFRVRRPDGTVTRHLIGHAIQNNEGRVSSAIVKTDLQSNCMVTSSGRVYQLDGAPGENDDAQFVFANWLRYSQFKDAVDITGAYTRLRRMRGFAGNEH